MSTPADLTVTPRNRSYGHDAKVERWWWRGDPVGTALYNAFSVTFPPGERFFIETLKDLQPAAPAPQQAQIAAFMAQKSVHAREHAAFNRHVADCGFDLTDAETRTRERLARAEGRHVLIRAAVAVALEHFTAILGHALLADPRYLAGVRPDVARLWRWHAMEEIEHKAVLFDAFMAAAQLLPRRRRWLLRTLAMTAATRLFVALIGDHITDFLRQDGLDNGPSRRRLALLLLVEPGVARAVFLAWLAYFRPGFHPWRRDDRSLLRAAERELAMA